MKKICLISSSGGHFEQLLMLKKLSENHELYIVTEKTKYTSDDKTEIKTYYTNQVNRFEKMFVFKMIYNLIQSSYIFIKEKPDIIISTGALSVIPTFLIGKIFRKKLIFIESFAKTNTPTLTGKLIYQFSDVFIVQWESMKTVYPKAIYLGSIY
ncbi:PssD/Cps14F family polysaccharide biosynthesis glycosyltransferase [Enterococcus casseliflavus]|uniref:PssD/Cps14F family polysaccharide biosynthesis glycosyltransferase n=1 Tax=Enterococcus casseliflavus TaxID=37734 RepID=UPI002DBF101A|nr:PssD/Cps14F family polysaccharide biosynthesis glycosyltransferase [Enterococcus casseliflavus]MEB6146002.1 UDP-N-acetylglucosamine transferase subunit ALG14 [Enterococcus casseliflavus]